MIDERFKERCNKDLERHLRKEMQRYGARLYVETVDNHTTYTIVLGSFSVKHRRDLNSDDNLYPTRSTYGMRVEMLHDEIMRAVYGLWVRHHEFNKRLQEEREAARALFKNQEIEGGFDKYLSKLNPGGLDYEK